VADLVKQPTAVTTVPVEPDSYTLSELPYDHPDRLLFEIKVQRRSVDGWAVLKRGTWCLGIDGTWDRERIPSNREDPWLAGHRFPLAEALERAQAAVPGLTCNGWTVARLLASETTRS
jgi:hypothetical protein